MTEQDLFSLHESMKEKIEYNGGRIDKIYHCPHLLEERCNCRKPKTGMLDKALDEHPNIIIQNSYLIGDSISDIDAGEAIGLNTIKVDDNYRLWESLTEIL